MSSLLLDFIDDSFMRVSGKEIAAELLEMTFRKDQATEEYHLPI